MHAAYTEYSVYFVYAVGARCAVYTNTHYVRIVNTVNLVYTDFTIFAAHAVGTT